MLDVEMLALVAVLIVGSLAYIVGLKRL